MPKHCNVSTTPPVTIFLFLSRSKRNTAHHKYIVCNCIDLMQCSLHESKIKTAIVHNRNTAIVHKKNTAVGHKQSHTALVHTFLWLPKHCNGTAQPTSWLTRSLFIETNLRNKPLMRAGSATEFSTTRNNYQSPEKNTFFPN